MASLPSWAGAAVAGVLLAVGLTTGVLTYRSHVYDEGFTAGLSKAADDHRTALDSLRQADAAAAASAASVFTAKLKEVNDAHQARTTQLEAALATARADSVRLSQQLVRLHDAAAQAGDGSGPAADASGPGAESDASDSPYSLADLMRTVDANYTICQANSAQLTALQDWYESLRAGRAE
ncbi:hypothetical protein [Burkholderia pseudomallei]|uniref:hypothetical protein n=1 Tax=Burkholderia pseudomallei TaxID=28450 RepID=UPI000F0466D9|nr:hypothetical protein [Burkholderia pseudomallei]